MRRSIILAVLAFAVVLGAHAAWHVCTDDSGPWATVGPEDGEAGHHYVGSPEMWLGLSYATAAGFAAFCLSRFHARRQRAMAGAAGGLGMGVFLYAAGCFLLGCCGSPMLTVYAGLLGPRFLGFTGPLVFGFTLCSVVLGGIWLKRREGGESGCGGNAPGDCCATATERRTARHWIAGRLDTPAGPLLRVSTVLHIGDHLGTLLARLGTNRMHYTVPPGIYGVGEPSAESPVFVTANYKMSFDRLRAALHGRDGWILVLDTRGINVWCAAGKGTFGTDELAAKVEATALPQLVSHRTLVLPQLGAPGVAGHEITRRTGFRVVYGPVRAEDLPAFMDAGMSATPHMRQVTFGLGHRLALIPMEVRPGLKYAALLAAAVFLLAGFGDGGYSLNSAVAEGTWPALLCAAAFLGGAAVAPALLPWLPGRAFSVKGAAVGLVIAAGYVLLRAGPLSHVERAAWLLIAPAASSFFAMNFTGASTYTSLSGVKREMRFAVPAQIAAVALGLGLWTASRFI